jgi:dephospho-CoA kinase
MGVEVFALHGAPGSGKSTLARAIVEHLGKSDMASAVIDPDELGLVHPPQGPDFIYRCLKALWPIYAAVPDVKVVIPTVIKDAADLDELRDSMPAARFTVCELVAPRSVLEERVVAREPNDYWKSRLLSWVDAYSRRDESLKFGDFQVETSDKSIADTVEEIIEKAGWQETLTDR